MHQHFFESYFEKKNWVFDVSKCSNSPVELVVMQLSARIFSAQTSSTTRLDTAASLTLDATISEILRSDGRMIISSPNAEIHSTQTFPWARDGLPFPAHWHPPPPPSVPLSLVVKISRPSCSPRRLAPETRDSIRFYWRSLAFKLMQRTVREDYTSILSFPQCCSVEGGKSL